MKTGKTHLNQEMNIFRSQRRPKNVLKLPPKKQVYLKKFLKQ